MDLGWTFNGFWMDLDGFWQGFGCFSAAAFAECQRRAGTKRTNGKPQEHADICRNMQKQNANK